MNSESFILWALDGARTVEERFTLELLVEQGVSYWNAQHKIYCAYNWEARRNWNASARSIPPISRNSANGMSAARPSVCIFSRSWWNTRSADERQIRDLKAFAFLTELEDFKCPARRRI